MAKLLTLSLLTLILGACSSTQYYMIPVGTPTTINNTHINKKTYALRNLDLPDYLTDQYLIFKTQDGRIDRDNKRRWADDPESNIRRNLQQQLATALAIPTIYTYPLNNNIRPNSVIDIQVRDIIGDAATRQFRAIINWQVTNTTDNHNPQSYQFNRNYPLNNTDALTLITLYQQALTDLSNEISLTLLKK